ncbi:Chimeric ERCC6-PGBD3 protein [Eumeta japonica]|uniref:Chimeric ERCC6-PGBD3 protein n=1 Tax=Eumeta variegata TaxID=151549 RepID=A0A4C1YNQ5_EUMVA|nr:Chimeric ERCC6-PGBD3 protein [Eumeta japonica]
MNRLEISRVLSKRGENTAAAAGDCYLKEDTHRCRRRDSELHSYAVHPQRRRQRGHTRAYVVVCRVLNAPLCSWLEFTFGVNVGRHTRTTIIVDSDHKTVEDASTRPARDISTDAGGAALPSDAFAYSLQDALVALVVSALLRMRNPPLRPAIWIFSEAGMPARVALLTLRPPSEARPSSVQSVARYRNNPAIVKIYVASPARGGRAGPARAGSRRKLPRPLAAHEILDALENVSDNEEDYRERLICILPPPVDPDCLTDEDSGEEDNVTLNNLPRNILLQPAEVMIQGQIMVSDTEEEPSDSTGRTKRRRTYAWRKRDLAKNPVNWPDVQGACQDKRPIEWFENFLDEDVISLLVSESNKYAVKKNLPGDITTEDMKCFIGILLIRASKSTQSHRHRNGDDARWRQAANSLWVTAKTKAKSTTTSSDRRLRNYALTVPGPSAYVRRAVTKAARRAPSYGAPLTITASHPRRCVCCLGRVCFLQTRDIFIHIGGQPPMDHRKFISALPAFLGRSRRPDGGGVWLLSGVECRRHEAACPISSKNWRRSKRL